MALQRFLEALAHLFFGVIVEFRTISVRWLRGHGIGCPAQEFNLGSVASAPDAIEQVYSHPEPLIPTELGIH